MHPMEKRFSWSTWSTLVRSQKLQCIWYRQKLWHQEKLANLANAHQVSTVQICYYEFPQHSCLFSLLGITLMWLVARSNFFLCCHCFWIIGIPNLPRSSELSLFLYSVPAHWRPSAALELSNLRPICLHLGLHLHQGIFTGLAGCPRVSLRVQWTS